MVSLAPFICHEHCGTVATVALDPIAPSAEAREMPESDSANPTDASVAVATASVLFKTFTDISLS